MFSLVVGVMCNIFIIILSLMMSNSLIVRVKHSHSHYRSCSCRGREGVTLALNVMSSTLRSNTSHISVMRLTVLCVLKVFRQQHHLVMSFMKLCSLVGSVLRYC